MADLVNLGANVVAYKKNGIYYAMTCAWCMNCDYDQLLLLIGSQSDTGNDLEVGDVIGISALSEEQEDLANHFGETHSKSGNKLEGISYNEKGSAILICGAKNLMVGKVVAKSHIFGNEEDHLVQVHVDFIEKHEEKHFLKREDMK